MGQTPSSQNAQYRAYHHHPNNKEPLRRGVARPLNSDVMLFNNAMTLSRVVVHDPTFSRIPGTSRTDSSRPSTTRRVANARVSVPSDSCRVCYRPCEGERLANHHLQAERHRNLRSRNELRQTTDRPELWCAICETRFTHSDRRRKHMEEMAAHNSRYGELQLQARDNPDFDHSVFDPPPMPPTIGAPVHDDHSRVARHNNPCQVCNVHFSNERMIAHHQKAERHRNLRSRSELHQTTDRPELWCSICETRFTHTDRKQAHMEEMNAHNTRFRDLQSRALREPNFDRSIFEVPESIALASVSRDVRTSTTEVDDINYCTRCERYFTSAGDLAQHVARDRCDIAELSQHPLVPPSSETSPTPMRPLATRSENDLSLIPPPPYEEGVISIDPQPAPSTSSFGSTRATFECALCLEHEDNLSSLACGHIFGTRCIQDTLEDDPRCPICRNDAVVSDLRRIFLS